MIGQPSDSVRQQAQAGLRAASRWRLDFWNAGSHNLDAAQHAVDQIEASAPQDPDTQQILRLMRRAAAAPNLTKSCKLGVYRTALTALNGAAASSAGNLAGIAIQLLEQAGPNAGPALFEHFQKESCGDARAAADALKPLVDAGVDARWALEQQQRTPPMSPRDYAREALTFSRPELNCVALVALKNWPCLDADATKWLKFVDAVINPDAAAAMRVALLDAIGKGRPATLRDITHVTVLAINGKNLDAGDVERLRALLADEAVAGCDPAYGDALTLIGKLSLPTKATWQALLALTDTDVCHPVAHAASAAVSKLRADQKLTAGFAALTFLRDTGAARQNHDLVLQADFARMAVDAPLESDTAKAEIAATGLAALANRKPGVDGLAKLALRVAGAAETYGGKLSIARGALEQASRSLAVSGTLRLRDRYDQIRALADVEDDTIRNAPNRVWFRAASTLSVLRFLAQPCGSEPVEVARAASRLVEQPWAHAGYVNAVGSAAATLMRDEANAGGDVYTVGRIHVAADEILAETDPEARARRTVTLLHSLATDQDDAMKRAIMAAARTTPGNESKVESTDQFVSIGGLRVARSGATLPPGPTTPATTVAQPALSSPPALLTALPPLPADLHATAEQKTAVTIDQQYKHGFPAVYNPMTDAVVALFKYKHGIGMTYDPRSGTVESRDRYKGCKAIIFNPTTRELEEKEKYKGGVCGVYNPLTRTVVWQEHYKTGVAGVFNPSSGEIEWQNRDRSGVAARFLSSADAVDFHYRYKTGMRVVTTDPACPTLTASSFMGYDDDWD